MTVASPTLLPRLRSGRVLRDTNSSVSAKASAKAARCLVGGARSSVTPFVDGAGSERSGVVRVLVPVVGGRHADARREVVHAVAVRTAGARTARAQQMTSARSCRARPPGARARRRRPSRGSRQYDEHRWWHRSKAGIEGRRHADECAEDTDSDRPSIVAAKLRPSSCPVALGRIISAEMSSRPMMRIDTTTVTAEDRQQTLRAVIGRRWRASTPRPARRAKKRGRSTQVTPGDRWRGRRRARGRRCSW